MITLQYNLNHVIMFFGNVMDRNYDVIIFIQNTFILIRPGAANFAKL